MFLILIDSRAKASMRVSIVRPLVTSFECNTASQRFIVMDLTSKTNFLRRTDSANEFFENSPNSNRIPPVWEYAQIMDSTSLGSLAGNNDWSRAWNEFSR